MTTNNSGLRTFLSGSHSLHGRTKQFIRVYIQRMSYVTLQRVEELLACQKQEQFHTMRYAYEEKSAICCICG